MQLTERTEEYLTKKQGNKKTRGTRPGHRRLALLYLLPIRGGKKVPLGQKHQLNLWRETFLAVCDK